MQASYRYAEGVPLRWDHGPVSFGLMVANSVVSWSAPAAKDYLVSRCWSGVYLYPTSSLVDGELAAEPLQLLPDATYLTRAFPCDWDHDGTEDLLLTDRPGFLYTSKRSGDYPDMQFSDPAVLRDAATDLPLKLVHDNPTAGKPNTEGGYVDPDFFCYLFPLVYPRAGDGRAHLLIGDSAGHLWWLEDGSAGAEVAKYAGESYSVPPTGVAWGTRYREERGIEYSRPKHKVLDEAGEPLLLGQGADWATLFRGGWVKPLKVRNPQSGRYDLVVLTGGGPAQLLYLRCTGYSDDGVPMFAPATSLGMSGASLPQSGGHGAVRGHGTAAVDDAEDPRLLLMPEGWKVAIHDWRWSVKGLPSLAFNRYVTGDDARACAYNITEILTDERGSRYALDSRHPYELHRIEAAASGSEVRLASAPTPVCDQGGEFRIPGETDNKAAGAWGFDRVTLWRHRSEGADLDMIVGSDAGNLYLLLARPDSPRTGVYRSVGPLRDTSGKVFKIHNRVVAVGVDLRGNGYEDLVLAASSYQMGIASDPDPGAGLFYIENLGPPWRDDGSPRLAAARPLQIEGLDISVEMNQNLQLQSVDVDGDGAKEVVVALPADDRVGRICKANSTGDGLVYTGRYFPRFVLQARFLDIDGDGELEHLFSGGEVGQGYYAKLIRQD
jgi:hypothetical protein